MNRLIICCLMLSLIWATPVALFSPNGQVRQQIIQTIQQSTGNISLAIYSFTSKELAMALLNAKQKGQKVRIIADRQQARHPSSVISFLATTLPVRLWPAPGQRGIMHHKYLILGSNKLLTGSYNWSNNAEYNNQENAIILEDLYTIKSFQFNFNKLWQKAIPFDSN